MFSTDLSAYLADRDDLIKRDRALRLDAAKLEDLSATEAAAEQIVRAIKAEEAVSVWGAKYKDIEHPFPGMEFLTSKSVIAKTKVFHLLQQVRFFPPHPVELFVLTLGPVVCVLANE